VFQSKAKWQFSLSQKNANNGGGGGEPPNKKSKTTAITEGNQSTGPTSTDTGTEA